MLDLMARDGLSDPETGEAMGEQTERLIAEEGVTRAELDEIAVVVTSTSCGRSPSPAPSPTRSFRSHTGNAGKRKT